MAPESLSIVECHRFLWHPFLRKSGVHDSDTRFVVLKVWTPEASNVFPSGHLAKIGENSAQKPSMSVIAISQQLTLPEPAFSLPLCDLSTRRKNAFLSTGLPVPVQTANLKKPRPEEPSCGKGLLHVRCWSDAYYRAVLRHEETVIRDQHARPSRAGDRFTRLTQLGQGYSGLMLNAGRLNRAMPFCNYQQAAVPRECW
jgi:hypothetical protein